MFLHKWFIIHSLKRLSSYYHRQWQQTIAAWFTHTHEQNRPREREFEWIKGNSIISRLHSIKKSSKAKSHKFRRFKKNRLKYGKQHKKNTPMPNCLLCELRICDWCCTVCGWLLSLSYTLCRTNICWKLLNSFQVARCFVCVRYYVLALFFRFGFLCACLTSASVFAKMRRRNQF